MKDIIIFALRKNNRKIKMKIGKYWWVKAGLIFGAFIFVFVSLGTSLLLRGKITGIDFAIGIPIWTIAGLGWGYFLKRFLLKQERKKQYAKEMLTKK